MVWTPAVGHVRQAPPQERCPAGQVTGWHTPPTRTWSIWHEAATHVSFGPHWVVATPAVGHVAHVAPHASFPVLQLKVWQVRLDAEVLGHRVPPGHEPQLATVRDCPHLSVVVSEPQVVFDAAQSWASVGGVQPHTLGVPPPPQVWDEEQVPQLVTVRVLPHESMPVTLPQFFPSRAQNAALVSGAQPQTFAFPPPPHV